MAGWEWPFSWQAESLLIDPYTQDWKVDMVTQLFSYSNASAILSIPFSFRLPGNQMIWAYTPKGDFTARSAYKIALDEVFNGKLGEASNS